MQASIYIGFDKREAAAFAVAKHSLRRHMTVPYPIYGIVLDEMQRRGLFWRPMEQRGAQLWDVISDAPMSTQFSLTRFLTPHLARERLAHPGAPAWALFMDGDMLVMGNVARLFEQLDERFAVMCVKHHHEPAEGLKMDGMLQTTYARKNWSSLTAYNIRHEANQALTVDLINTVPGRDLHRFSWLSDDQIGELHPSWNWLTTYGVPTDGMPRIIHFTNGTPDMAGHEEEPFAEDWRQELRLWAM